MAERAKADKARAAARETARETAGLAGLWRRERARGPLWAPVLFGAGVLIYFELGREPHPALFAFAAALGLAAVIAARFAPVEWPRVASVAFAATLFGFALIGARAHLAAAPVLPADVKALVEGRVIELSRSASGLPRATLDRVEIYGIAPEAAPRKVRVTLMSQRYAAVAVPGARIAVMAQLGPPGGPVEPGGFDFRRLAWFDGLGGIGWSQGPPLEIEPLAPSGPGVALDRVRASISGGIRAALPGETGAFAAAISTGDRAGIGEESLQALRDSNLAHLLAISGLHMGLLTAIVFGAVRLGFALVPGLAVRAPIKKYAAIAALLAGAGYLALSGASVSTQRAFAMAAVVFGAVLADRSAVSLRALAVAAGVILLIRPESVTEAGFQMSFAATAGLIAVYEVLRERGAMVELRASGWKGRVAVYVLGVLTTSLIAGLATAPFSAAHFNRLSTYGLGANLLAVPLMGAVVAPAIAAAAALAPLGLAGPALWVAGRGIEAILWIARTTSSLDGAVRAAPAPPDGALALIVIGGLWLVIWRTRLRLAGAAPAALGLALWLGAVDRPALLVAPEGALIGLETGAGRALDHAKAGGYAAKSWLRRDGDLSAQGDAAARAAFDHGEDWTLAPLTGGWRLAASRDRRPDLEEMCVAKTIIIAPRAVADAPAGPCRYFDRRALAATGSLAFWPKGDDPGLLTAREAAGARLWTGPPPK